MELKDTVKLMTSGDYKERFRAEYSQLKIRLEKLANIINNFDDLDFEPASSKELLEKQLETMQAYLWILETRAYEENIIL